MRKILVADDDPLIRRLAMNTLVSQEFQVLESEDGQSCLEVATREQPDLILLDTRMPKLYGAVLSEALVRACPAARLVLLVGQGPEDEPHPACLKRAHERLDKPFSPLGLLRLTQRQLGQETESGEHPPLQDLERQQLLLYARDLARMRREDARKTQELRAAKQRLEQLEKDKDMFLALVSHELRTPLTIIKGNAALIRRVMRDDERLVEFAGAITGASDRLERLVVDMLNFSGMRTGLAPFQSRTLNLNQMLGSLVLELEPLARSRDVTLHFEGQPVELQADQERLQEAFTHLLRNAILFNRPGGTATLRCEPLEKGVRVTLEDTGVGMAPEEQQKVFLPFYQAQDVLTRKVEGLGLGLAITRQVIESHGGEIDLQSELGQGTRVKIFLPWQPEEGPELAPLPTFESLPKPDSARGERQMLEYARELYAALDLERMRRQHAEEIGRELERTFVETLATLMRAVGERAAHQSSHLDRVAFYATELARRLDPTLPDKRDFRYALLLHDVGKIGVAETLLQKVGQLSSTEQEQMRAHPSIGAELLESIDFLKPAIVGVRHHHERWDGQGYPDGLKGREIPLPARIIAVADAFDAMTVDRPYRKALKLEEARGEVLAHMGTQFDPAVVAAFEDAWPTIESYAHEKLGGRSVP